LLILDFSWRSIFRLTRNAILAVAPVALPSTATAPASSILSLLSLGKIFGAWLFLCQ
jgi:hypothetical protein